MRSRYTAHVRDEPSHLAASWHPDFRPDEISHDESVVWRGLEIVDAPAPVGDQAEVEFIARFRRGATSMQLHERSRFVAVDGQWLYTDGTLID